MPRPKLNAEDMFSKMEIIIQDKGKLTIPDIEEAFFVSTPTAYRYLGKYKIKQRQLANELSKKECPNAEMLALIEQQFSAIFSNMVKDNKLLEDSLEKAQNDNVLYKKALEREISKTKQHESQIYSDRKNINQLRQSKNENEKRILFLESHVSSLKERNKNLLEKYEQEVRSLKNEIEHLSDDNQLAIAYEKLMDDYTESRNKQADLEQTNRYLELTNEELERVFLKFSKSQ